VPTFVIDETSYPCPHCRHLLEDPDTRWRGWLLCAHCGLPFLPPARLSARRLQKHPVAHEPEITRELAVEQAATSKEFATIARAAVPHAGRLASSSAPRLIIPTGLFVSALLLLVAYLDRSSHRMAIFGSSTVIFFVLQVILTRRR
jgi:hypothetical protein